jgi:hypothetical protein
MTLEESGLNASPIADILLLRLSGSLTTLAFSGD